MKLYFTLFVLFALLALAFILGSQNDQIITINYLIARADIPVAMAVSIFTVLGFFLGLFSVLFVRLLKPFKRSKKAEQA